MAPFSWRATIFFNRHVLRIRLMRNLNGTGLRTECSCTSTRLVRTAAVCHLAVKTASPYLCWAENLQILALAFPEEEG